MKKEKLLTILALTVCSLLLVSANQVGAHPSADRDNALADIIYVSGTISTDTTWTADNLYVVEGDVTVAQGISLVVESGTIVKFQVNTRLIVQGALDARGTTGSPIVFTSINDDDHGGDTDGDGSATPPAKHDWGWIEFADSSDDGASFLEHCHILYGGKDNWAWADHLYGAITLYNASPSVANCTFQHNYINGIQIPGGTKSASTTGNTEIWHNTDVVYVVTGDLTIAEGMKLVVNPGVTVKFNSNTRLIVQGALDARGTVAEIITFTSFNDDGHGGDTDDDGSNTPPGPNDWGWIEFADSSDDGVSFLEHCHILYGGKDNWAWADHHYGAVRLIGASPTICYNIIAYSSKGLWAESGSSPLFHENSLFDNSQYAVYNADTSTILDAENNWWGHPSGPYHPTLNPDGQGDDVSDNVDFIPWLTTPPTPPATYSISGHVRDDSSDPISDVTISAGAGGSATTDATGAYTISGLPAGTYTFTPSKSGYTFSPATRTVSVPPDAAGQDFTGMPVLSGFLYLNTTPIYVLPDPLTCLVQVYNPNTWDVIYTIYLRLRQEGNTLDTLTKIISIPAKSTTEYTFDFGIQDPETYELVGELWAEGTLLLTVPDTVEVVRSLAHKAAMDASWRLTRAALWEFQQAQDLVVHAYEESVVGAHEQALKFFLDRVFIGWAEKIGNAGGLSAEATAEAANFIATKLSKCNSVFLAPTAELVRRRATSATDAYLNFHRQDVQAREQAFDDFVQTKDFHWTLWMEQVTRMGEEYIGIRVEGHPIERGFLAPLRFIGTTTLWDEDIAFSVYHAIGTWLSWFGLLVVVLVSFYATAGSALLVSKGLVSVLASLGSLKNLTSGLRYILTIVLIWIAFTMDTHTETIIAPAIAYCHGQSLDTLEQAIGTDGRSGSQSFYTRLYSADGRLVGILTPELEPVVQQAPTLQSRLAMPAGSYRAVTALHTGGQPAVSGITTFKVTYPQVDLALRIAQPHITISQSLQASVDITNTDATTGTGDLGLLVASSDGENLRVEPFDLAAGANYHTDFSFVPPAEGSYVLQAVVIDNIGSEIAFREAGYVVGSGPSLAVNVGYQPEYNPGVDVSATVTATNAGDLAASSILTLVTMDRDIVQPIYTQTLPLNLASGEAHSQQVTVLPDGQPGRYYTNLLLDDALHRTLFFLVTAEDTLWVTISANPPSVELGQPVTLTAQVVNTTYTTTNALVTASVIDPALAEHVLAMSQTTTGTYQGAYTPILSGTYEVWVRAQKPNWRGSEADTTFVADQPGWFQLSIEGILQAGQTKPISVTVQNEQGFAIPTASVILSGTSELLYGETDAAGNAVLWATPQTTDPYRVTVRKLGYTKATTIIEVSPFKLYLPLILRKR